MKVMAGIHWEAAKLWRKRVPLVKQPPPPPCPVTIGQSQRTVTSPSASAPASEPVLLGAGRAGRATDLDIWSRAFLRLAAGIVTGELRVVLPDGSQTAFAASDAEGPRAVLGITRTRAFRRLLLGGDTAFAEAYMDGDWETPDLAALIELALANEAAAEIRFEAPMLRRLMDRIRHLRRWNTRERQPAEHRPPL